VKPAAECQTMVEVREGVDAIDRALVDLLGQRFGYMDAAARIKPTRDAVRDEGRKAQVIANAAAAARAAGLPDGLAEQLWETLRLAMNCRSGIRQNATIDCLMGSGASDGARTRDLRRDRPAL
jgi:isochorismate pyruvate lyase